MRGWLKSPESDRLPPVIAALVVASVLVVAGIGVYYAASRQIVPNCLPTSATACPSHRSPHPGVITSYEYTGGGATSEDPAIDFDSVGYEPIVNIYETLIGYNGSETGSSYSSFVPILATCVPGSPECRSQWGNAFTGYGRLNSSGSDAQNLSFIIDPNARFYDPSSGLSWGVYPSDVVFSLVRTMAFSTLPCRGCNNGWVLTQALLAPGDPGWDGGVHAPYNNTPAKEFGVFSINDSTYCPAAAMVRAHGCITVHLGGGGRSWPFFLQLLSDAQGGSVTPCGWFTAEGAGVPEWTSTNSSNSGDHPCTLPGGSVATNDSGFRTAIAGMTPTSWDAWEAAASSPPYVGNVQFSMVGSGPYSLSDYRPGASYELRANPAYAQPTGCRSPNAGCDPPPGRYAREVRVVWELNSPIAGEQAYQAGIADFASVPQSDLPLLLKLVSGGGVSMESFSTASIWFLPFNLNFDSAGASALVPSLNVPSTFFSNLGIRQFFVHAYPYATSESTIATQTGIKFFDSYGGAIPRNLGDYYPGNISWPAGDPNGSASARGTAAWWWAQIANSSSPFYDPWVTTHCSSSSPCTVPVIGQTAAPQFDASIAVFSSSIASLTGGALKVGTADIPILSQIQDVTGSPLGQNPLPMYTNGVLPDYPDPTDYVNQMYLPDSTFTFGDSVQEQLASPAQGYDSNTCHPSQDPAFWMALANGPGIPGDCQGHAFAAMNYALSSASNETNHPQRVLDYWRAESIANGLALYLYWGQQVDVTSYGSWVDGSSVTQNVAIAGSGTELWFAITGNGIVG